MARIITAPGVLKNVQGQIDHVTDMYDDIKDNNLKPLTVTLDPVTSANGSYSHTTQDERVTEDMKAIAIEVGTPESFYAPIEVTTGAGTVTLTCSDTHGNSTVKVTFIKTSPVEGGEDYPPAVTSTEFDILADRIGSLETLSTTDKSDLVNAMNEVNSKVTQIENPDTITSSSKSDFESKIATFVSGLNNLSVNSITVGFSASFEPFNGNRYFGHLFKTNNDRWSAVLASTGADMPILVKKNAGDITYEELALNSKITRQSGEVAGQYKYAKMGNVASITIFGGSFTVAANGTLFTVPNGYRPYADADFVDSYSKKRIKIYTNGDVISTEALNNEAIRGTFTYII